LSRLFTLADQQRQSDDSYLAGYAALNDYDCHCWAQQENLGSTLALDRATLGEADPLGNSNHIVIHDGL
jgi:hypothetical protein